MSLDQILTRYSREIRDQFRAEVLAKLELGFTRSKSKPPVARKPNVKRTAEEINRLTFDLHTYVIQHPGQCIEQIADGMGVETKALVIAVKRLLGKSMIATRGQKRATSYRAVAK